MIEPIKAETVAPETSAIRRATVADWVGVAIGVLLWVLAWWFFISYWHFDPEYEPLRWIGGGISGAIGLLFVVAPFVDWEALLKKDPPLAGEKGHGGARKATQAEAKEKLGGYEQRPPWADHHYQD